MNIMKLFVFVAVFCSLNYSCTKGGIDFHVKDNDPPIDSLKTNYIPTDGIVGFWGTSYELHDVKMLPKPGYPIVSYGNKETDPSGYTEPQLRITADSIVLECNEDIKYGTRIIKYNSFHAFVNEENDDTISFIDITFNGDTMFWKFFPDTLRAKRLALSSEFLSYSPLDTLTGSFFAFIPHTVEYHEISKEYCYDSFFQ